MRSELQANGRRAGGVCWRQRLDAAFVLLLVGAGGCTLRFASTDQGRGGDALERQLDLLRDDKPSPVTSSGADGAYTVVPGDTLWGIARTHGVSASDLAAANGLELSAVLAVGQRLTIPQGTASVGPPRANDDPLPTAENRFQWPVRGTVIVPYGKVVDGFRTSGIVIAAARGQAVAASKSGVVSFVSDSFEGWGKVIVVKHSDGWHTWYGHLGSCDVRVGEAVRQGQTIGTVGNSGRPSRHQLSFRILHRGRPANPAAHLR